MSFETRSIKIFALRRKAAVIPDTMSGGPDIQAQVVQWPVSGEIAHIAAADLHRQTVCAFLRKLRWFGCGRSVLGDVGDVGATRIQRASHELADRTGRCYHGTTHAWVQVNLN